MAQNCDPESALLAVFDRLKEAKWILDYAVNEDGTTFTPTENGRELFREIHGFSTLGKGR